jgi:hypothetical protein
VQVVWESCEEGGIVMEAGDIVKINGKEYQIVMEFPVMWSGWEGSYRAWVVSDGKENSVAWGFFGYPDEIENVKVFHEKLKEDEDAIDKTRQVLRLWETSHD